MSRYKVFEISKNGKKIIKSDLSLENAESLSLEVDKSNLENVYGYEPDVKEECKVTKIDNILAKYENFYKGGSGYTFQIEADDFNVLVEGIAELKKENKRLLIKNNKLIKQMGIAFENDELN